MAHPYKTYTIKQFQEEEKILREKLKQAEQDDRHKHVAIYTRKIEIVQSFMLDAEYFQPGDVFELKEDPQHLFEVDEIKGVFAWGFKINIETEEKSQDKDGFLLVMLGKKASK